MSVKVIALGKYDDQNGKNNIHFSIRLLWMARYNIIIRLET
jgi:hypothetical protein